jgi:N12 class adenine-specific DNA methylase/predicted RNA methylase
VPASAADDEDPSEKDFWPRKFKITLSDGTKVKGKIEYPFNDRPFLRFYGHGKLNNYNWLTPSSHKFEKMPPSEAEMEAYASKVAEYLLQELLTRQIQTKESDIPISAVEALMKVTPETERELAWHMMEAGQDQDWAKAAATLYSRGVSKVVAAWGVDPNEFLLNKIRFERMEEEEKAGGYHQPPPLTTEEVKAADAALKRDEATWKKSVDSFDEGTLSQREPIIMLQQTPLILQMLGVKNLPILTRVGVIRKALRDKHNLTDETLKEVPAAMTDPIMVFKSATQGDSLVMMLELKDKVGATVIVPVLLEAKGEFGYTVNVATSIYGRANKTKTGPDDQWFIKQIEKGHLLYISRPKGRGWARTAGLQLPGVGATNRDRKRIPNEEDFVKFREGHPGMYQSAFSASPNRYDAPNLKFIGSGEGAQVHGWGLYALRGEGEERRKYADERYRKRLLSSPASVLYEGKRYVRKGLSFDNDLAVWKSEGGEQNIPSYIVFAAESLRVYGNKNIAAELFRRDIAKVEAELFKHEKGVYDNNPLKYRNTQSLKGDLEKALKIVEDGLMTLEETPGQVQKWKIPDDDVLLHEDLPLSKQPEKVREALKELLDGSWNKGFSVVHSDLMMGYTLQHYADDWGFQKENQPRTRWTTLVEAKEAAVAYFMDSVNGSTFYHILSNDLGSDRDASECLLYSFGIQGIAYVGEIDGPAAVIFNDQTIEVLGTYYQYAGQHSVMSPEIIKNLLQANTLAENDADNEAIRQQTGWFQGMDKKWRYEIPDNAFAVNFEPFCGKPEGARIKLPLIYDNDALYAAYPFLRDFDVVSKTLPGSTNGYMDMDDGSGAIYVDRSQGKASVTTLIHEIQHAIQGFEGFSRGGSPSEFLPQRDKEIDNEIDAILADDDGFARLYRASEEAHTSFEAIRTTAPKDIVEKKWSEFQEINTKLSVEYEVLWNRVIGLRNEKTGIKYNAPYAVTMDKVREQYNTLAGEIEARDAADRSLITDEQRADRAPDLRNDAIVVFGGEEINVFQQSAWSASPNRYNRPSMDFIGKGEGVQVHGWGLYAVRGEGEDRKEYVDKRYRERLNTNFAYAVKDENGSDWQYDWDEWSGWHVINTDGERVNVESVNEDDPKYIVVKALNALMEADFDEKDAIEELLANGENEAADLIKNGDITEKKSGQVQRWKIPDDDGLLDEDLALDKQPEKVKEAINKIITNPLRDEDWSSEYMGRTTGGAFYRDIAALFDDSEDPDKEASLFLNKHGIEGITYVGKVDGPSVVIFNDEAIKVLATYYQYAGPRSNMSPSVRAALAEARRLATSGADNEVIRRQTGWFRGMDEKWRYEISDNPQGIQLPQSGAFIGGKRIGHPVEDYFFTSHKNVGEIRTFLHQDIQDITDGEKEFLEGWSENDKEWNINKAKKALAVLEPFSDSEPITGMNPATGHPSNGDEYFKLVDIYDNPKLYEAYPDLKDMEVSFIYMRDGDEGMFQNGHIILNRRGQSLEKVILHEIQHAIQRKEEFARGGSQNDFAHGPMLAMRANFLKDSVSLILSGGYSLSPSEIIDVVSIASEEQSQKMREAAERLGFNTLYEALNYLVMEDAKRTPYGQYERLAGEVEARDTAKRSALTDEQRAERSPAWRGDAIIMFGGEQVAHYSLSRVQKAVPGQETGPRGRLTSLSDGSFLVSFGLAADASTAIHEEAHLLRELMRRVVVESRPEEIVDQAAYDRLKQDWETLENWLAIYDDEATLKYEYDRRGMADSFGGHPFEALNPEEKTRAREVAKHEHFARGFETYLMEGQAPTEGLRGVFARMKGWLLDIYKSARELDTPLTDEVREVFDRLVVTQEELSVEKVKDSTMNDNIVRDALGLSSGTLATLTGLRNMAELDKVQQNFVRFVSESSEGFETWMQAWDAFHNLKEEAVLSESSTAGNENSITPGKSLKRTAKRAKIDPRQYSFDFEVAAALADQLEAEIDEEETQDGDDRPTFTVVPSPNGVETGNDTGNQQEPVLQPLWVQSAGSVGHEQPGETESPGSLWPDPVDDAHPGSASAGTEHTGEPGDPGAVADGSGGVRDSGDARSEHGPVTPLDYVITEADRLGEGGAKTKFRDNINALALLKRLQSDRATVASPEEQRTLVKYVGWGGIPQAFDLNHSEWHNEAEELRQLLGPEEYLAARRSTQDAHYTSAEVVQGIYQGLERLGFQGPSRILEPSAGIGNFVGLMPEALRAEGQVTAVELDPSTAAIGGFLYPTITYLNRSFESVNIPDGHFDLALGNPPFGNQPIYDPERPYLDYSIHNYFLAKSIESLREGGLAAFVVSRYFLDAEYNQARDFIAARANLVGAIRLPNTAFKKNALTEVTTDILFFQRTTEPELEPAWTQTGLIEDTDGNPIKINQYFIDHPEQMAGRMAVTHKMYRDAADLLPPEDFQGFPAEISSRLEILPQGIYQPRAELPTKSLPVNDPNRALCEVLKVDAFFVTAEGGLARRKPDVLGEPQYEVYEPKNQRAMERISGLIRIRDCLTSLMLFEQSDRANELSLDFRRAELNRLYNNFVKKHGFINSLANRQAMRDDPEWPLLTSLERDYDPGLSAEAALKSGRPPKAPSASKADIFYHRILGPRPQITHVETPKEALLVSMNEKGKPDLEFMQGLCGHPVDQMIAELAGLIYQNPAKAHRSIDEQWEIADHYLTGNVKDKLAVAQKAAESDGHYKVNVEALLAVQPPDLDPVDIAVQLGSTWLPPKVVADFGRRLFGSHSVSDLGYHPALGAWVVDFNMYRIDSTLATVTWGTDRYSGPRLFESILNHTPIRVMDEVGRDQYGKPILEQNDAETAAANQKADEIKQAFLDWIWLDQGRREDLARLYNDRFNTHVPRKYNGSHLELPGTSIDIQLRQHQKDAIWRGVQDGTALFDHVVGAGKTMVVIGTIMESRRMGLMKKPMVVVPNHLLNQWQDAFYSLYPQANILVATKDDFKKENRQRLFARVATGDWDAVIVAHSSFKKIGLPKATLNKILTEQINDLTQAIEEMKRADGQRNLIKEMEKTRARLQAKMERRADTGEKDKALTFADLGVDGLCVDESQEFKNLFITTKMRNVAGLGNLDGSEKAFDLFVKCRYLQEQNNGRGVFFATGTPISNTIAEMFTIQRFLQYDELKAKGLAHFDAWASTFGEVATGWELDATGVGYKLNSRFSKFQNVPELINMYRTVGDVITKRDLVEQNQGQSFTPKVKDGKPRNLVVERSPWQAEYMGVQRPAYFEDGRPKLNEDGSQVMEWPEKSIIYRMENLPDDPSEDNPLKITNDARKAGLDYRLIDPGAPDFEGSKVNAAADNILRLWKEWEADQGAQLVFCDLSTPKAARTIQPAAHCEAVPSIDDGQEDSPSISMDELLGFGSKFSVYDDLRTKLIERGIPAGQIRYIHEAKTDGQKAKLFDEVNLGKVRVLMGSTAKMGAGTNVQRRLVALHHLDAPWRPSDLEQREGRIIRQGNELHARDPEGFAVEIIRYATKQTYDARMWQTIESKANGIEQFRKGDNLSRTIEDVAGEAANAAEMKAAATGNELIFMQVKLTAELKKMEAVYATYQRAQHKLESRISWLEKAPERAAKGIACWREEIELRDKNTTKNSYFAAGGQIFDEKHRPELLLEVGRVMKYVGSQPGQPKKVGVYRGFTVMVEAENQSRQFSLGGAAGTYAPLSLNYQPNNEFSINGFIQRLDNYLAKFEHNIQDIEEEQGRQAAELDMARQSQGQPFPQMALLEVLRQDSREVMRELQISQKDPHYKSDWRPQSQIGTTPTIQAPEDQPAPVQNCGLSR